MGQAGHGWLRIVNWRPLQKYQKPNPPWIKLYTSLFNDDGPESKWRARERWEKLGSGGQSLLINLWLFVATGTTDGKFWSDPAFLQDILPTDAAIDLGPLLEGEFIEWVTADGERKTQNAKAESEGEGETEAEPEPAPPQAAEAGKESQRKSGSAARSAERTAEKRAEPQREARESPSQSQAQRASPDERRSESTAARDLPVIGNASPPGPIRLDPPESDGRGRPAPQADSRPKPPPGRHGEATLLGQSLPQALKAAADPVKYAWLADLYRRLKFPYAMDSPLGRQELGSFESVYEELMATGLPHADKMEILARDLEWAEKNGAKRRNRKRGAVFCSVHNGRVATYLARAGPRR